MESCIGTRLAAFLPIIIPVGKTRKLVKYGLKDRVSFPGKGRSLYLCSRVQTGYVVPSLFTLWVSRIVS
jgi:hypothetical protein